jgi:hypothetical protein
MSEVCPDRRRGCEIPERRVVKVLLVLLIVGECEEGYGLSEFRRRGRECRVKWRVAEFESEFEFRGVRGGGGRLVDGRVRLFLVSCCFCRRLWKTSIRWIRSLVRHEKIDKGRWPSKVYMADVAREFKAVVVYYTREKQGNWRRPFPPKVEITSSPPHLFIMASYPSSRLSNALHLTTMNLKT